MDTSDASSSDSEDDDKPTLSDSAQSSASRSESLCLTTFFFLVDIDRPMIAFVNRSLPFSLTVVVFLLLIVYGAYLVSIQVVLGFTVVLIPILSVPSHLPSPSAVGLFTCGVLVVGAVFPVRVVADRLVEVEREYNPAAVA